MKDKYSLWIVPKGEVGEQSQALISRLAQEYGSPDFVPHMTLVANIFAGKDELDALKARVTALAEQVGKFTLTLSTFGYKDEEFRCLYLLTEAPELQSVYDKAAEQFPQVNDEHFRQMPHLSVLYGNFPAVTKKDIIAKNSSLLPIQFEVESFDLCLTNDPVEAWKQERVFPLPAKE